MTGSSAVGGGGLVETSTPSSLLGELAEARSKSSMRLRRGPGSDFLYSLLRGLCQGARVLGRFVAMRGVLRSLTSAFQRANHQDH